MKEKLFTLEDAENALKNKKDKQSNDIKKRLEICTKLIEDALEKTNCSLIVNKESPLNNLQILISANK